MLLEKPSALKREHPALKKMKSLYFLFLWVIFALLVPDPDTDPETPLNPDPIRIRIWIHSIALKEPNSYFVEAQNASIVNKHRKASICGLPLKLFYAYTPQLTFCELFFFSPGHDPLRGDESRR